MGSTRKTHTYDEEIYAKAMEIAKKLSYNGYKFTLSNYLNEKLKELVEKHKDLLR